MKKYTKDTPIEERILSFLEIEDGWNYGYRYVPCGSAFKKEELDNLLSRLEALEIPNKQMLSIMPGTTEPGEDSEVNFDWEFSVGNASGIIANTCVRYVSMDINITKNTIDFDACVGFDAVKGVSEHVFQKFQAHEWKEAFDLANKHLPK